MKKLFKLSVEEATERLSGDLVNLTNMKDSIDRASVDGLVVCFTVALLDKERATDELLSTREYNLGVLSGVAMILDSLDIQGEVKFKDGSLFKSCFEYIGFISARYARKAA